MIPARHRLQLPPGIDDERARALLELLERRFGALPVERVLVYLLEHVPESALPALGWQFDIPPDSWSAADAAGRRQLVATALAAQRKRGTIGALLRALAAAVSAPAFVHRHTLPLADGSIWSDGTFLAGADRHPGAYWLVVATYNLLPEAREAITEIAAEWMRGSAHLKQIYLVGDASEFGDLGSYRTGPWDPARYGDLRAHYDFARPETVGISGDRVVSLQDLSARGQHLTGQNGGPLWEPNWRGQWPAARSTGSSSLWRNTLAGGQVHQPTTFYWVGEYWPNAAPGYAYWLAAGGQRIGQWQGDPMVQIVGGGLRLFGSPPYPYGLPCVGWVRCDDANTTFRLEPAGAPARQRDSIPAGSTSGTGMSLFSNSAHAGHWDGAALARVMYFKGDIATENPAGHAAIMQHLRDQYGIYHT